MSSFLKKTFYNFKKMKAQASPASLDAGVGRVMSESYSEHAIYCRHLGLFV